MIEFLPFVKSIISLFLSLVNILLSFSLTPPVPHKRDFELVWSDEFDGTELNRNNWSGHYFSDNTTLMRKGGYWNMDFATVKDGNLHISTRYCPDGYKGNGIPGWYSCGIDTQDLFSQTYGYFEVRCILPEGAGLWSAFWLMPDNIDNIDNSGTDGAEIDVFESPYYFQKQSIARRRISSNIHFDGYGEAHQSLNVCTPYLLLNNPYKEFNTYSVEWNEDEYIFYVNGVETGRTNFGGTSQVPEWMILSVEIGGENGVPEDTWAGPKIADDTVVTDFIIDYVRVYQYK